MQQPVARAERGQDKTPDGDRVHGIIATDATANGLEQSEDETETPDCQHVHGAGKSDATPNG